MSNNAPRGVRAHATINANAMSSSSSPKRLLSGLRRRQRPKIVHTSRGGGGVGGTFAGSVGVLLGMRRGYRGSR